MKVLITYSTREISQDSSFSVSRLIYFLYQELKNQNIETYCYSWGKRTETSKNGIDYIKLPFFHKIINKFFHNHRKKFFNRIIYKKIKNSNIDLVICSTFDAVKYFSQYFKDEQIVYWAHNYPARNSLNELLKYITKKRFFLITPSVNSYKRLWNEFSPEALPFYYKHIPNIALPVNANKENESGKTQFNFEYKNKINFIHVSGTILNKGLHIMLRIFFLLETDCAINFIYVGNKNSIQKIGNKTLIEVPRMSYGDLIELYNIADFGIMSSLCFESAPLTLHEMLENNVIPIITKSGGMEEITINTKYFTVDFPNDMDEWTNVIKKCLELSPEQISNTKKENYANYSNSKLDITSWGKTWATFLKSINEVN